VDGKVTDYSITPEDVGLTRASLEDIKGGATVEESAALVREVLGGKPGPRLDMVLLNSGAALLAAGKVNDMSEGVKMARSIIESGSALQKLDELVSFCRG